MTDGIVPKRLKTVLEFVQTQKPNLCEPRKICNGCFNCSSGDDELHIHNETCQYVLLKHDKQSNLDRKLVFNFYHSINFQVKIQISSKRYSLRFTVTCVDSTKDLPCC